MIGTESFRPLQASPGSEQPGHDTERHQYREESGSSASAWTCTGSERVADGDEAEGESRVDVVEEFPRTLAPREHGQASCCRHPHPDDHDRRHRRRESARRPSRESPRPRLDRGLLGTRIRSCGSIERRTAEESNRCHRTVIGGPRDALERKPPAVVRETRARSSRLGVVKQTGKDEGERGWSVTRAAAARWWPTGNLDPEGPMRPGDVALFPSGLKMITDGIRSGRSPVGAAVFRLSEVGLLSPWPQAQWPTRAEPDPVGRRRRSRWEGKRGLGPAGTLPTWVRSAEAPAPGRRGAARSRWSWRRP